MICFCQSCGARVEAVDVRCSKCGAARPKPKSTARRAIIPILVASVLLVGPSALGRNDPTLLAKSDPAPQPGECAFVAGQGLLLPVGKSRAAERRYIPQPDLLIGPQSVSNKVSNLRACGADDVKATRTPSAWMIMLSTFLARRQIVFLRVGHSKRAQMGHSCRAPRCWPCCFG